ncbi:MAG: winged helix-turn-helix transcriptional regulator [Oscillospiraceae bacterium]|nr:winged helix-turn-helix transcriptional regulator [Oscillospiraceae bacterium]
MIENQFSKLFKLLRLSGYRSIFHKLCNREGSLSATEAYAADVIYLLDEPTIKEFSAFLGISQPNASYKVNSLIAKGYIEKELSETDRRTARLRVTEKFHKYYDETEAAVRKVAGALEEYYSPAEIELFEKMLITLSKKIS